MDTELLEMFEDGLRRFNRERYAPAQLVRYVREGRREQLWDEMVEMGWFELLRSEDGHADIGALLSIFRAAGEGMWLEPIGCALGESAMVVLQVDEADLREPLLEGLISGRAPLAHAARERGDGFPRTGVAASARRGGDRFQLSGDKLAVIDDPLCAGYVVLAVDDDVQRPSYFLVEADAPGLEARRYATLEGRQISDLRLHDTPARFLCGGEAAARAQAWGSLLAATEAVGIMCGTNADTAEYLRQRRQFGRSLLDFQVLQHRLVEMLMLERETYALVLETADAFQADEPGLERRLLALRAQASRALRHVTREAVQMHGGMGVTQECRVSHYYRRALTLDSLYGSEDRALAALAAAA